MYIWEHKYKGLIARTVRLLLYLFISGLVVMIFVVHPGINGYEPAAFGNMIEGEAHRPFVYRTLVPSIIGFIGDLSPESIENKFIEIKKNSFSLSRFADLSSISDDYVYKFYITIILLFFSYFGFTIVLRKLIRLYYDYPGFVADFAPVGALLIIPLLFRYCNYMYDPVTLLLFSLALYFISTGKRLWFYLIFILAAINKETAILLTGLFVVKEYDNFSKKALISNVILQLFIWAAIKGGINYIYQNNPGSIVEFHLLNYNLLLYERPLSLIFSGIIVFVFYRLLKYRWQEKSLFLKNSFWIVLLPMVILALLFGYIDELRQYQEVFPVLFLLILPSIIDIFKINNRPTTENR